MKIFQAAPLALLLTAGSALAADLPATKAPPPAYAPHYVFSWTGCHVGIHVGGGWGQTNWTDALVNTALQQADFDQNNLGNTARTDMSGGVLGGQLGCDYQFANSWVLGVEGKFAGTTISGTNIDQFNMAWSLHNDVSWLGSVTGRIGVTPIDTVLLYARGGFAFANNNVTITNAGFLIGTGSLQTRTGWTAGGGVEWAFAPHWSAFLEGNYYDLGSQQDFFPGNPVGAQNPFGARTKQNIETLTVGVNYRFNWSAPSPVFAKY